MTDTFYDKPIQGQISRFTDAPPDQHDPSELIAALDALLAMEEVASVRWYQYTPYFNDGDACVFGIRGVEVLLTVEKADDENDDDKYRPSYSLWEYGPGETWEERRANMKPEIKGVNTAQVENRLSALEAEMRYHEIILSEKFGDPAEVVYDGEKFVVEHYDHD